MISVSAPHLAQFFGDRRALFRAQDYNLGLSGLGDDWGDIQAPIAGDMSKETISVHWIGIGWEARVWQIFTVGCLNYSNLNVMGISGHLV